MNTVDAPTGAAALIHVRARLWGATEADIELAVRRSAEGPYRDRWAFAEPVLYIGGVCPIDVREPHPAAIAADAGRGWAYDVYPIRNDG